MPWLLPLLHAVAGLSGELPVPHPDNPVVETSGRLGLEGFRKEPGLQPQLQDPPDGHLPEAGGAGAEVAAEEMDGAAEFYLVQLAHNFTVGGVTEVVLGVDMCAKVVSGEEFMFDFGLVKARFMTLSKL